MNTCEFKMLINRRLVGRAATILCAVKVSDFQRARILPGQSAVQSSVPGGLLKSETVVLGGNRGYIGVK